jgi:iron complex outermembrane receptor protein
LAALLAATPALAAQAGSTAQAADNEVIVTGVRQSLEKALQVKRQADDHIDVISATDIGKLPDRNVADALQRLPGINTTSAASGEGGFDENDRVSIRGTSPSLTQVTIDGHTVATGDWFILDQFSTVGRSISFTLLPSEMLGEADVYKAQDASLLEGGVAGTIDLKTRSPLDLRRGFTVEGSAEAAYNSLSQQAKPQINGFAGWRSDDGTFGVIVQGFYEDRTLRRYGQETLGYSAISATSATGYAIPSLVGVQAPTLIGSTLFQQEREREGGVIAAQWRPNDRAEFKISGFYSKLNASNVNDNYMYWGSNEIGNNVPTSYKVVNNTLVAATFPLSAPAIPALNLPGGPTDGIIVDNITRPNASGRSYYVNLDGKYRVTDRLTVKAQLGYTQGDGSTPSEPAYEVDALTGVSYQPSGNGWQVTPTNLNPQSPAGLANDWAWNETFKSLDKELYFKVDGDLELNHGAFKDVLFGARFANHTRDVSGYDRGCQIGPNGQCWTGAQPYAATNPTA